MGILEGANSDRHHLTGTLVIGRSPSCQLMVSDAEVSGVHAEILWDGSHWQIQDLASRNGTFLNGERLPARERVALVQGSVLRFGSALREYRLMDASAPRLVATSQSGQLRVADDDGLVALPSPEQPVITIYLGSDGQWIAELAGTKEVLAGGNHTLVAAGMTWNLQVPLTPARTEVNDRPRMPSLADIELFMSVSRDGEHVELWYRHGARSQTIESRAHFQLLVLLAEVRKRDAAQPHLSPSDCGWMHREDLLRMLAVDAELLNLWVYRVRKQFSLEGIIGGGGIIERRAGTLLMRIGTEKCSVERG
jgi:pSer/pThr/pTyr-binding forkhead associated (FHA) protein